VPGPECTVLVGSHVFCRHGPERKSARLSAHLCGSLLLFLRGGSRIGITKQHRQRVRLLLLQQLLLPTRIGTRLPLAGQLVRSGRLLRGLLVRGRRLPGRGLLHRPAQPFCIGRQLLLRLCQRACLSACSAEEVEEISLRLAGPARGRCCALLHAVLLGPDVPYGSLVGHLLVTIAVLHEQASAGHA
jgi:hypothetical protein